TTPAAVSARAGKSRYSGRGWRSSHNSASPHAAAITARAPVRKTGSKSATATLVAGSEPAKIATPINPLPQPLVTLSIQAPSFYRRSVEHGHVGLIQEQYSTVEKNCTVQ